MVWGFPRFLTGELKELAGQAREGRRIQRCMRIGRTLLALGLRARVRGRTLYCTCSGTRTHVRGAG